MEKAFHSRRSPSRSSTSLLVRAEACSWFLHRYGEEAAPHFQLFIDQLDHLTVLDATPSRASLEFVDSGP